MKCIENSKRAIENGRYQLGEAKEFQAKLQELMEQWNNLSFDDVMIASRSNGKHLGKLFKMLTLRVPRVCVEVEVEPQWGYSQRKVGYRLSRRLPQDTFLYAGIEGKRHYFPQSDKDVGDGKDLERMWRQHFAKGTRSYKDRRTPENFLETDTDEVEVEICGVKLLRGERPEECRDIMLMIVLAKFRAAAKAPYAPAAYAWLWMCWKKQRPYYLLTLLLALATIISLVDITYCIKVQRCPSPNHGERPCCVAPEDQRRWSPTVVLCAGVWFLATDAIYCFVLYMARTDYLSTVLRSSKCFEVLLEGTTTLIAAKMAWNGWTFAEQHYIQYFLVVACSWLHLLYILIPLPVIGKTVLPMFKAVISYESRAFILINITMLAGAFQAYISLRSDINARDYTDGLEQPIEDALLQQYRLNFLGDFSIDEMRGEGLRLGEAGAISTAHGDPERRRSLAVFMIFVTFLQAVLMLNLYIGILSESYNKHKGAVASEFAEFRAHFMLKNLALVRFTNKYLCLERLNHFLANYDTLAEVDSLWVVRAQEHHEGEDEADTDDAQSADLEVEDGPQLLGEETSRWKLMHSLSTSMSEILPDERRPAF